MKTYLVAANEYVFISCDESVYSSVDKFIYIVDGSDIYS